MIETAGYQHLYGIAPVLNALKANVRDFTNKQEREEERPRSNRVGERQGSEG